MRSCRLLWCSAVLLALALPAEAASYSVKAGGGGNFTTIQACANTAAAGDTCTVYAGSYNEFVTISRSGTAGNPITFNVNSGDSVKVIGFTLSNVSYVTIGGTSPATGFEITDPTLSRTGCVALNSTSHVTIQYNNIHQCSAVQAIRFGLSAPSSYTIISHNTIAWPAATPFTSGNGSAGAIINGDHVVFDSNDISHVTDFISAYGAFMVIRNNLFHDVRSSDLPQTSNPMHVDGLETECTSPLSPLVHALVEGNTIRDSLVSNSHGWLFQDAGCGSDWAIVRFNTGLNIGSYYILDNLGGYSNVKWYNDTVNNATANAHQPQLAGFFNSSVNGAAINNIYYNSVSNNGWVYDLDSTTTGNFVHRNNLGYNPSCGTSCTWTSPFSTETNAVKNRDPLFVNAASDLHLQSGSPARGAGSYLTTVSSSDSGSGTTLVVADAAFFQDGAGIVNADWIRVGTSTTAQIASINYATNTITLTSSISRSPGSPVYLYKDSNGRIQLFGSSPDIGAYQYGQALAPAAPSGLRIVQ